MNTRDQTNRLMGVRPSPVISDCFVQVTMIDFKRFGDSLGTYHSPQAFQNSSKVMKCTASEEESASGKLCAECSKVTVDGAARPNGCCVPNHRTLNPVPAILPPVPLDVEHKVQAQAQDNFAAWSRALEERDYDGVAALYDSPPTIAGLDITSLAGQAGPLDATADCDYLAHCLTRFPCAEVSCQKTAVFGPCAYLHTGLCTFLAACASGRERPQDPLRRCPARPMRPCEAAKVRFSYLWSRGDGGWSILHHHSSLNLSPSAFSFLPQQPPAAHPRKDDSDDDPAGCTFVCG